MYQALVEGADTSAGNLLEKIKPKQTKKTVKTRTINMNYGYESRNIQTISNNVAHVTTNNNYNKSLTVRQRLHAH